jgi:hypothetical protein
MISNQCNFQTALEKEKREEKKRRGVSSGKWPEED